ncbi:hypothetical protein BTN49_2389 [Candidatus Enterovibrio escicola]|uniref:Uncharacterized protein n=1 Tax=Candidatus Enterovibrio escicola TaxID=1927127 RepID=A0A2A5T192_9GAMM|nr:hypothetical protein BTN49_2389 [Candidatus Enterovibrio escacola]
MSQVGYFYIGGNKVIESLATFLLNIIPSHNNSHELIE